MKILHTSDWHLGHTLYNYDRTVEQQAFLRQLTRIVTEEQPDAMVVSGDIYHYSSSRCRHAEDVNRRHAEHSPSLPRNDHRNHRRKPRQHFQIGDRQQPLAALRLERCGNIERTAEEVKLDKHMIEINNEKKTIGYVIAVPHVYPQNFPLLDTETPRDQRQARFFQALLDEVKKRNTAQLPVVLMAHLLLKAATVAGTMRISAE